MPFQPIHYKPAPTYYISQMSVSGYLMHTLGCIFIIFTAPKVWIEVRNWWVCVCVCVCTLSSHRGGTLHCVANDHDDPSLVVLQDPRRRTLHELTVGAERWAVGNIDAARDVASAEAGGGRVKERGFKTSTAPEWAESFWFFHKVTPAFFNGDHIRRKTLLLSRVVRK